MPGLHCRSFCGERCHYCTRYPHSPSSIPRPCDSMTDHFYDRTTNEDCDRQHRILRQHDRPIPTVRVGVLPRQEERARAEAAIATDPVTRPGHFTDEHPHKESAEPEQEDDLWRWHILLFVGIYTPKFWDSSSFAAVRNRTGYRFFSVSGRLFSSWVNCPISSLPSLFRLP